jgi:hypothetical protein
VSGGGATPGTLEMRLDKAISSVIDGIRVPLSEKRLLGDKAAWGFFYGGHVGDLIVFSCLTRELCRQRGGERVILAVPGSLTWVPALLPSSPIVAVSWQEAPENVWRFLSGSHLTPHTGILCPMHPNWLASIAGWGGTTFLDFYLSYLRLDRQTVPEQMRLPNDDELRRAELFMEEVGLPVGKTALVCPMAFSVSPLVEEQRGWNTVVSELVSAGYTVAINGMYDVSVAGDAGGVIKSIFPPLALMRSIAALCGTVISRRSGLVDLLGGLPIRTVVVYGSEPYLAAQDELSFYSQRLMRTSSTAVEVCGDEWWKGVLQSVLSGEHLSKGA